MLADTFFIVLGLMLLLAGGEALVRGASAIARTLGLSEVFIGLTVVAFGTSAPELVVSLSAALDGRGDIAFGNALGSNAANVGLLLGLTALLVPLRVHSKLVTREIPFLVVASLALVALALDSVLGDGADTIGRGDGLVLLLLFAVFIYVNAREVMADRSDPVLTVAAEMPEARSGPGLAAATALTLGGMAGLMLGGNLTVDAAAEMARGFGVGEVVIAATLVAVGTSLPELATCLIAARRGANDLAVGNVVGSNLFNILFVLATTSVVRPVVVPANGWVDLAVTAGLALALLPIAVTHQHRVTRGEALGLLAVYVGYIGFQLVR